MQVRGFATAGLRRDETRPKRKLPGGMGDSGRIHRGGTVLLSLLMAVIGLALVAQALTGHGGVISDRTLLGALFAAAGSGRLWLVRARRGRRA